MLSFATPLASQIGFSIASLNKDNYKSIELELSQFTEYGMDGSLILLRNCLEQVNLHQGEVHNLPLKLDLLARILKTLIHQPNSGSILCEALGHTSSFSEGFLENICSALKFSIPEQIGLGLALSDAEDQHLQEDGQSFCKAKISEIYENPTPGLTESLIEEILEFLHHSEGLTKHVHSFMSALQSHQPNVLESLLLTPLFQENVNEVNCLRSFNRVSSTGTETTSAMCSLLSTATKVADVLEELGYSCTVDIDHCKGILGLFPSLTEIEVAQILGMVARTYHRLEDLQGIHSTFCTALCNGEQVSSDWLTTWDVDVLLDSIKQLAPDLSWRLVMEKLDYEGFLLPDQKSFSLLLRMYGKVCQDPFPLEAVCGHPWKNGEGQLSFLVHAVSAPPEVFTFAHSLRKQIHRQPAASPNHAWLSLDLLEVLCDLAELGYLSSVRSLLEVPLQHCPELLIFGLAQIKTDWNVIQAEMLPLLLPAYLASNATSSVVQELWLLNADLVMRTMVEMHAADPSTISRILDVCHELKVLDRVLESTPFQFSVELAAIAARRDFLNLEKWLQDNLTIHRDSFFQACLKFLKEKTILDSRMDRQVGSGGMAGQRQGPTISLALETTQIFFKVLHINTSQLDSGLLVEDFKLVREAAVRANPRLMGVAATDQPQSEAGSEYVDEEANSYFQRIYIGQLTIDDVVDMLKRFNSTSSSPREKAISACMVQSLFEEYQFFPRYPDRELRITAVLFGSLVKHQLVSSVVLGQALRCVLDALRKPPDSKMLSFGSTALDQFKERLAEWPQYCNHILQISHFREIQPELVKYIERALMRGGRNQHEIAGNGIFLADQQFNGTVQSGAHSSLIPLEGLEQFPVPLTSIELEERKPFNPQLRLPSSEVLDPALHAALGGSLAASASPPLAQGPQAKLLNTEPATLTSQYSGITLGMLDDRPKSANSVGSQSGISMQATLGILSSDLGTGQKASHGSTYSALADGQSPQQLRSKTGSATGVLRQPSASTGFGHALNIGTLVAAAETRDSPIEVPSSDVQDKIAFIMNNISITNLDQKAKECLEVLKEEYHPWFAQYMVMKRASIEPNYHDLYIKFLDKLNSKGLQKEVLKASYENCKVLLRSELIKVSSEERSLLKNLGSWLGKLTIGKNQALRAREVDPKSLIIEAYEKGLMIAVIPFTSKVLEPCQASLVYQPPNPWTMAILGLLCEIYAMPNLKMNLKFDIEVLFKTLNVDMKDVKPSQLLGGRERDFDSNPDFSNKDLSSQQSIAPPGSVRVPATAPLQPLELPFEQPASISSLPHTPKAPQIIDEDKITPLSPIEISQNVHGQSQNAQTQSAISTGQVGMSIPNLAGYVVLNPKLTGLVQTLQLQRIVPLAMDRAIREIITPVVERSVTIACMTTRELVLKDFAMEADENYTRSSAGLMVASLAGSLAHVTCKEPLRVAMTNYLRNMLQVVNLAGEVLDQAVNLVTNDNLDLGCAVIEKSATEKAQRDLSDAIGPALAVRRNKRDGNNAAYYDAAYYSGPVLSQLPEILRPKPGRLSSAQQRVYEDFARLPWQNQPSQSASTTSGPLSGSSIPVSAPYASGQANGPAFNGGHSQAVLGNGGINQVPELGVDDLDLRGQTSLSFSSVNISDRLALQTQETSLLLPHFSGNTTSSLDTNGGDVSSAFKGSTHPGEFSSPSLPTEQLGPTVVESSLTTGEVMEKYHLVAQKLDTALPKVTTMIYAALPPDHEVRTIVAELQEIITQAISRDEAALAIAQKIFQRLYEYASSHLHISVHLTILEAIRDVCKRVVKELTSWVIYSDEERRYNREITVGLIRSELINLSDYNVQLTKLIDGGRNKEAVDFAAYLVKTCVIEDAGVSNTEFYNVIDALGKLAARPDSPVSLQQLVEIARTTSSSSGQGVTGSNKEDKIRMAKDKKVLSSRSSGLREDGKLVNRDTAAGDPPGLRDQVASLFDEWASICDAPGTSDKAYAAYVSQLQHSGMLKGDDISDRFFRILIELAVAHCLNSDTMLPNLALGDSRQQGANLSFAAIDMFAKLVLLLVKYYVDPSMSKVNLLNKVMVVTVRVIQRDFHERKANFQPRPYFRLFVTWLVDFNAADPILDSSNFQVLTTFGTALLALQPLQVPGWSFAWLELISHRMFMPKLLLSNSQKGWPLFQRLLVALFKFMEPYLRNADVSDPVRLLYKGTLRVLLVLLHDFPEFLCDHHFTFCDVIPPSCIQMRNLILSAFPRNMRLPDPFTPNLKVDLLPEISQAPHILYDLEPALKNKQLKAEVDEYLKTRHSQSFQSLDIKARLVLPANEGVPHGTKYNVPLLNALVLYIGMQALQHMQSKTTPQQLAVPTAPITHSAPMDIFQRLITDLDTEGRYLFLNAVANQLRYPNNHTHYFSCVLLSLFAEANMEIIQEQITRVLLERLIVNRPHPWGLLITFIELIKNPRYNFWSHSFTRCAPEIEKLFESVARSCMGPPLKPTDDDLTASLGAEGLKN
ncbi:hypothetical protein M758_8G108900 [Ceratodon purpureus]|nr:hypothetical protein M758_8G108900 [Ceratodon purpureus]